jgi:hypothetical protein
MVIVAPGSLNFVNVQNEPRSHHWLGTPFFNMIYIFTNIEAG